MPHTHSYQVEGAVEQDGRGPSIWDTFCQIPGKIADGSSGAVACDSYNRTADDIALLRQLGARAYRFSLSWSRIIPLGGRHDPVNPAALAHYARFVDDLLAAGITPFVTLYHWDLPDALEQRYGGLRNKDEFPLDFERYARVVFAALPRCKYWITFNEPWCSSILGYSTGYFAPGRTSDRAKSPVGDSAREPWLVGHNLLLAHGRAVKAYRDDFQPRDQGRIGITLNGDATYPWDPEDPADVEAAERKIEFAISWFADPIYLGDYPASMRAQLGDRLPQWAPDEIALVRGSNDFYGMNHYTANYIRHKPASPPPADDDFLGHLDTLFYSKAGECVGPETQSFWLRPNPRGFRELLVWLSRRYGFPDIYVTENGTSIKGENDMALAQILEDDFRADYFDGYVRAMAQAAREDGVKVRGYLAWSLMDNFEWAEGYETRCELTLSSYSKCCDLLLIWSEYQKVGVTYVDYANDQKRYPKKSAKSLKPLFDSLIKKEEQD